MATGALQSPKNFFHRRQSTQIFFYHVCNTKGKKTTKTTMRTNKTKSRRTWIKTVLKKGEVDNSMLKKKKKTKQVVMYYQKIKITPGSKEKLVSYCSHCIQDFRGICYRMKHSEPLKMVESNLNSMQTLVLDFPTETSPKFLGFEEERHLLANILEMKILEKLRESLGTFQMVSFRVSL